MNEPSNAKIYTTLQTMMEDMGMLRKSMDEGLGALRNDVQELKQDVAVLKQDVAILKKEVTKLKADMTRVKKDIVIMKKEIANLKVTTNMLVDKTIRIENKLEIIDERTATYPKLYDNVDKLLQEIVENRQERIFTTKRLSDHETRIISLERRNNGKTLETTT